MPNDEWISELPVSDETIKLVRDRLALECHDLALASGIPSEAVEMQLSLVHEVLVGGLADLILISPVAASGAAPLAVRITFDPATYRRLAEAAKDRVLAAPGHS